MMHTTLAQPDEKQSGCDPSLLDRVQDKDTFAEKYKLKVYSLSVSIIASS